MCARGIEVGTTEDFFLRCQLYSTQRLELFEHAENVEPKLSAKNQVLILLHGSQNNNSGSLNQEILKNVISYLEPTAPFDSPLINF